MNADLLKTAAKVIPNPDFLVNVVRLRVRQLCSGHRPLVVCPPGLGVADIALMEIIAGKLTFASKRDEGALALPTVLAFPGPGLSEKAA